MSSRSLNRGRPTGQPSTSGNGVGVGVGAVSVGGSGSVKKPTNLFGIDSSIQEYLKEDNFQGHFLLKDFIANITERPLLQSKDNKGPFDPKPFIRTIESSVEQLLKLRSQMQDRVEVLGKSVKKEELNYKDRISEIGRNFDAIVKSFDNLESRISEVGHTAIRIGEQLDTLSKSKTRASTARDLIGYYYDFVRGDTSRLDKLRKEGGREGRYEAAMIAHRLDIIAKEIDGPGAAATREAIEKYCERLETDMLKLFDRAYRSGEPKKMAHCAKTLIDFNGGNSVLQIYVNQHDFFITRERVGAASLEQDGATDVNEESWVTLADPDADPSQIIQPDRSLVKLYDDIRKTVKDEANIIQAVFPDPLSVMSIFLQRVFAQSIQTPIERLMSRANKDSTLTFLRILQMVHSQTGQLINDLKEYNDLKGAHQTAPPYLSTALGAKLPGPTKDGPAPPSTSGVLSTMLDTALEELFVPYLEGTRHIDRERKNLTELYASYLLRFTNYHQAVRPSKAATVFDRVINQLASAAQSQGTGTIASSNATTAEDGTSSRLKNLMKLSGLSRSDSKSDGTFDGGASKMSAFAETDGDLSLDVAKKLLRWHAEAVGRCVELTPAAEVPKSVQVLLQVLDDGLGKAYVETALETMLEKLNKYDVKTEPDLSGIELVKNADAIINLAQRYMQSALIVLAAPSVTVRREMVLHIQESVGRAERKASSVMSKVVENVIAWLGSQLSKQKKTDYNPRDDDDTLFSQGNTSPCLTCVAYLVKAYDAAQKSLSGRNLDSVLLEVGIGFHTLLMDHMKRNPVSAAGGLLLTKDVTLYQDTILQFDLPLLSDRYEMLRQLSNLFIVQASVLRSYMSEGYLARIEPTLLIPFLQQRVDYRSASIDKIVATLAPMSSGISGAGGSAALGGGGGGGHARAGERAKMLENGNKISQRAQHRISVLMRDLNLDDSRRLNERGAPSRQASAPLA